MKNLAVDILLFATLLISSAEITWRRESSLSFLPHNSLYQSANLKTTTGISQLQFHRVIEKLFKVYDPEITKLKGKFTINGRWEFASVNAFAYRHEDQYTIEVSGGLARHPLMTEDAFALAICHEIGHLLGGLPKFRKAIKEIYTNEGQADYFAALKCLRLYFSKDDNKKINSHASVSDFLKSACEKSYQSSKASQLCIRIGNAALEAGRVHAAITKTAIPSFETPDRKMVEETSDDHPSAQCRLDTYLQGALCSRSVKDKLSDEDEVSGACHSLQGDSVGLRPSCWFRPKSE